CRPSGAHRTLATARGRCVNCATSPVSTYSTCSCSLPSRSDRKAIRRESGAQTGALSRQLPRVNSRTRDPSALTIQRLLRDWSFTLSTHSRAKTTWRPSGEMAGLLMPSMSKNVSLSSRRGDWAAGPADTVVSAAYASTAQASRRVITTSSRVPSYTRNRKVRLGNLLDYAVISHAYSLQTRVHAVGNRNGRCRNWPCDVGSAGDTHACRSGGAARLRRC